MKPIILTFVLAIVSIAASAQTIEYGYDACGNRISRQIVFEKKNKNLSVVDEQKDFSEEQLCLVGFQI